MDKSEGVSRRKPGKTKTFRRRFHSSSKIMKPNSTTTMLQQQSHSHHQNPNNFQISNPTSSNSTATDRDRYNCSEQKRQKLDVKQRPPDGLQLPSSNQKQAEDLSLSTNSGTRTRTVEDFLYFCDVVLKYTNYPHAFLEEEEEESERHDMKVESPLNSVGESAQGSARSTSSISSNVGGDGENEHGAADYTDEDDSWHQVTCWCGKPFAGRPMIECESCFVWLHLTCARVRKSNIPEHFKCSRCKPPKTKRKRQVSGNSDGDSPGTSNNGLLNLPTTPSKSSSHSLGLQHNESPVLSPGGSNAPSVHHSDFRRNSTMKSPPYYSQSTPSNGNNSTNSPSKTAAANRRLAKPRPRRPAIASSTTNSFENPTLLPLRLTITTSHNPPPFS